jgi:CUB domain
MDLTGYSGTVTSQNYPNNYDNNADCQWRITAVEADGVSCERTLSAQSIYIQLLTYPVLSLINIRVSFLRYHDKQT